MNESQISCSTVDRKREGLNDVTYFVSQFTGISATNIIVAEGISSNMKEFKALSKRAAPTNHCQNNNFTS